MLEPARFTRTQRELRSLAAQVGADDPESLAEMVALLSGLATELVAEAARTQHERGYSWAEIAAPLGITRQSAHERFTRNPCKA